MSETNKNDNIYQNSELFKIWSGSYYKNMFDTIFKSKVLPQTSIERIII